MECIQLSLSGKMFPELSAQTAEKISEPCWKNLPTRHNQTFQFLDLRGGRWCKAGAIIGNGWSLAWRLLNAEHWGVPQRRKRIAVVADFRGQCAAEILFERTGLSGNKPTLGSLFDGIGGFPLVWETAYGAGTAVWASEIEEFPIAVTKRWFGNDTENESNSGAVLRG